MHSRVFNNSLPYMMMIKKKKEITCTIENDVNSNFAHSKNQRNLKKKKRATLVMYVRSNSYQSQQLCMVIGKCNLT